MSGRQKGAAFEQIVADEARHIILDVLQSSLKGSSNCQILTIILRRLGVNRDREWVQAQILELAKAGFVQVSEIGTFLVVEVTK